MLCIEHVLHNVTSSLTRDQAFFKKIIIFSLFHYFISFLGLCGNLSKQVRLSCEV